MGGALTDRVLKLTEHPVRFWIVVGTVLAILFIGFGVAIAALVVGSGADDRAITQVRREAAATAQRDAAISAARDLRTCRRANRNRPQIAINTLAVVDGVLQRFGVPLEGRKVAAAAAVARLRPEQEPDRSIGPTDCNGDGIVTHADYPPGQGPRPILGADGLPSIRRP